MPFKIVRQNLVHMNTDAIVNTANPMPIYGAGTDSAVYQAAGAEKLLAARQEIGRISRGAAAITPGFDLNAKYIIHTVGPIWQGGDHGEEEQLKSCYRKSLQLAEEHGCESIAFPLISSGSYGYPKDLALQTAIGEISHFLMNSEMMVYLVVFSRTSLRFSEKLFSDIESYIDDHYVEEQTEREYPFFTTRNRFEYTEVGNVPDLSSDSEFAVSEEVDECSEEDDAVFRNEIRRRGRRNIGMPAFEDMQELSYDRPEPISRSKQRPPTQKKVRSLADIEGLEAETFQQMLLRLIAERGMKNSEVYTRANMQKQLFSKIKKDEWYQPKKATVLALAIALKLNLDETTDLLMRAGYAFSPCSKADWIVRFFIEREIYDIYEIEVALADYHQPSLCNYG